MSTDELPVSAFRNRSHRHPGASVDDLDAEPFANVRGSELRVEVELVDGRFVVTVSGDVDLSNVERLIASARMGLESTETAGIVLDLSGVTFFDSSGLGGLIAIRNAAGELGRSFSLRALPSRVSRLLQITGLTSVFAVDSIHG